MKIELSNPAVVYTTAEFAYAKYVLSDGSSCYLMTCAVTTNDLITFVAL